MAFAQPRALIPADSPLAWVERLFGPYLWLTSVVPVYRSPFIAVSGVAAVDRLEVEGTVKPPAEFPSAIPSGWDAAYKHARSLRKALYGQAEAAIEAAEAQGMFHDQMPEICFGGELRWYRGEMMLPEATVRLWLRGLPEGAQP